MTWSTVFAMVISMLISLAACKSEGIKLRESVDYLIEHPKDAQEFARLAEMSATGSEMQRAAVVRELSRFANEDPRNADLVLPVIHNALSDRHGVVRRVAVLCLLEFSDTHILASAPELLQLMDAHPEADTFFLSCEAFVSLENDSCTYFPQLLEFLHSRNVPFSRKKRVIRVFTINGRHCPELAFECLQNAADQKDSRVGEEVQRVLEAAEWH